MGEIVIIQKNGTIDLNSMFPLRSVTKAEHRQDMLSSDEINITFQSTEPVDFFIGDKLRYENRFYTLNYAPKLDKQSDTLYIYDITFEGIRFELKKKIYFNFDGLTQTDFEFPLTGEIDVFLFALINNANLIDANLTWSLGEYPLITDAKTISFSNDNCLSALQRICEEFDTEFEIIENLETKTAVINIKSIGSLLPYSFEYGKGLGLYTLKRDNINTDGLVTRLYVYGSSENIPSDYRGYSRLLKMPASLGKDYIEDEQKIRNFGLIEGVKTFDDIKPTFTGIISAVGTFEKDLQTFTVSNMDFDLNEKDSNGTKYLIAGNPAKIKVNKGNLAGYEFEINNYNHVTKTFKIKQFTDERGQKFPDPETIFSFGIGDEFVFLDIIMPEVYVLEAEEKLYIQGLKAYEKDSQNNVQYSLDVDDDFFRNLGGETTKFVGIGDKVTIKDDELGINKVSRVIGIIRDLINPYKYTISISDTFEINIVKQWVDDIKETKTEIKVVAQNTTQNYLNGYKLQKELRESIFDPNGFFYTDNIQPLSIRTMHLSIGDDSQQIVYDNVTFSPNFGGDKNALKISAGDITHLLINATPTVWGMLEYNELLPTDDRYYIYAKCSRSSAVGTYVVSKEQIIVNADPDAYHFLLALLHKPLSGIRTITMLDGMTSIQGGYITTKKISSIDGTTWFDLDMSAFLLGNTAGMTGSGGPTDVFWWGGASFENRANAPLQGTKDGFLKVKNAAGQTIFEIGQIDDEAVFNIYNNLGVKIAQIGERGIEFIGYIPETYRLQKMRKLTASFSDNSAMQTEIGANILSNLISQALPQTVDNDWKYYKVELDANFNAYLYNAGRNFESAGNLGHEGYYPDENKFGTPIDDGVYTFFNADYVIKGTVDPATAPPIPLEEGVFYYNGEYTINFQVHNMVNGKIIDTKMITVTQIV